MSCFFDRLSLRLSSFRILSAIIFSTCLVGQFDSTCPFLSDVNKDFNAKAWTLKAKAEAWTLKAKAKT
jgi:hypothetical protein